MARFDDELDTLHEENRSGFGRTVIFRAVTRGTFVPSTQSRSGGSVSDTSLDVVLRPTEKTLTPAGGGEDRIERRVYEIDLVHAQAQGLADLDALKETHRIVDEGRAFQIREVELEAGARLAIVSAEESD
jgi:hypothetical protein